LHYAACAAHQRVGNYWHMLPEYSQARKAIWDAINPHSGKKRIDEAFPKELRKTTRDQEMTIVFLNGSTWQVVGSDNFNSLMGTTPAGLVMSEYALGNPSAWGYLSPILMENNGWALFISTPRGNNHFKALCKSAERDDEWFCQALTAEETGVFTKQQLDSELRRMQDLHGDDYGRSLWMQEYFVSFDAAIPGAIWADAVDTAQRDGRIGDVAVDGAYPVSTAWDLGRTDDTVIWFFQVIGGQVRVVDWHSSNNKEIPFYGKLLRDWARKNRCSYGTHWVPHDAKPRRLGMGGKSIWQQLQDENVGRFAFTPNLDRQEGIQAGRATLAKAWFDRGRCEMGIEHLRAYHREWDDEKKRFSDVPMHDYTSHTADAWRYLSLVWRQPKNAEPTVSFEKKMLAGGVNGMTFGKLKGEHMKRKSAEKNRLFH